jgi:hypothetical protein
VDDCGLKSPVDVRPHNKDWGKTQEKAEPECGLTDFPPISNLMRWIIKPRHGNHKISNLESWKCIIIKEKRFKTTHSYPNNCWDKVAHLHLEGESHGTVQHDLNVCHKLPKSQQYKSNAHLKEEDYTCRGAAPEKVKGVCFSKTCLSGSFLQVIIS